MTLTSPSTRLVIGNFLRFEFDFHKGEKSFCQTIYICFLYFYSLLFRLRCIWLFTMLLVLVGLSAGDQWVCRGLEYGEVDGCDRKRKEWGFVELSGGKVDVYLNMRRISLSKYNWSSLTMSRLYSLRHLFETSNGSNLETWKVSSNFYF